jgi:NAD(P)-dependent dehydrogenase (short-subunit alcohol dehydrogenase family)
MQLTMDLEGTVALVTGANRGLGKAYAEALLDAGAGKVYAAARDPRTITDPRVHPVRLDVTDQGQVDEVAAALQDVTLLVNNAGIAHPGPPLSASLDSARQELEVNYLGTLRMAQAFDTRLDVLVNVLSVASFRPLLGLSTYAASKAAAWSITQALREELEGETLVVAVHAGFIDTDLAAAIPDDRKIAPGQVAEATLDAIRNGETEVLVDEVSRATKAALSVT